MYKYPMQYIKNLIFGYPVPIISNLHISDLLGLPPISPKLNSKIVNFDSLPPYSCMINSSYTSSQSSKFSHLLSLWCVISTTQYITGNWRSCTTTIDNQKTILSESSAICKLPLFFFVTSSSCITNPRPMYLTTTCHWLLFSSTFVSLKKTKPRHYLTCPTSSPHSPSPFTHSIDAPSLFSDFTNFGFWHLFSQIRF